MEIGVVNPQIELGGDPRAFEKFGRAAEQMGYEHLLMYDHVVEAEHANRDPRLWSHIQIETPSTIRLWPSQIGRHRTEVKVCHRHSNLAIATDGTRS